ncbi:MAG: hypothetical protein GJ671_01985 [Alteromonadaceae bacterium]|nr:hypothetical protein [Alteromonadaceae bacterium]
MTKSELLTNLASLRTVKLQPEHQKRFDMIFQSLLDELDAPSALSIVLTEQIAECVFWMRQHSNDKEEIIYYAMGEELVKSEFSLNKEFVERFTHVIKLISEGKDVKKLEPQAYKAFDETMLRQGLTLETLRAKAMLSRMDKISDLDAVISRHVQNLRHLQKGIDAYDIKKRLLKRLDLEIKELEQKTNAIEHQS